MHISEYVCKNCLKELEILLKYRETFETFVPATSSSKNTGLPQFFLKVFWQLYFKNINILTNTKRCLKSKTARWAGSFGSQNHIFQKGKSFETSDLINVISCYNIYSRITSQQAKNQKKNFCHEQNQKIFSKFLYSILSSHFWPLSWCMCKQFIYK